MAHITSPAAGHFGLVSIVHAITNGFRAIGRGLVWLAETNTRARRLEALSRLSDEQLEQAGLKREDIVAYVFRDSIA